MIQVFGSRADPHVEAVARHLHTLGASYRILDIFDPQSEGVAESVTAKVSLSFGTRPRGSWSPRVVWWRIKPAFRVSTDSIDNYYDQQFCFREWVAALDYMSVQYKECLWVNPRHSEKVAANKIHQLNTASHLGFSIPRTVITNQPRTVHEFLLAIRPHKCLHKTTTPYLSPMVKQKYASIVDSEIVAASSEAIEACPSIYQEYIVPKYELRVTAIGDRFYAAQIKKKDCLEPDWRREITQDIYSPFEVDEQLHAQLTTLQRAFGLIYAAYDFLVDDNDQLYFLEVNPAGQWLWLEERLQLPISDAMAQYLAVAAGR